MAQTTGEVEGLSIVPMASDAEDRAAAREEIQSPVSELLLMAISRIERNEPQPKAALSCIHDAFNLLVAEYGLNGSCNL